VRFNPDIFVRDKARQFARQRGPGEGGGVDMIERVPCDGRFGLKNGVAGPAVGYSGSLVPRTSTPWWWRRTPASFSFACVSDARAAVAIVCVMHMQQPAANAGLLPSACPGFLPTAAQPACHFFPQI